MPVEGRRSPDSPPNPRPQTPELPVDYTDADLAEALAPLIPNATSANAFPEDFEAALRSAMRRTLAQHTGSPFDPPDFFQRTAWRFGALLSSRTYEEIVEQKTGRFRIEELYLLESDRLSMISFASVDPARHVNPHKVHSTIARISDRIRSEAAPTEMDFGKGLRVILRQLDDLMLAAVVRGTPDRLVESDLDYALRRIQQYHGSEISSGAPLLTEIQPLLEECLLIHSPLAPTSR
ncbi:hypothetical protein [Haloferula rosea]|uniref:Uncharacterized protein n=1 Tax=Haloferula rosea TaxID=490093 RepID=A0A934RA12_9BACT|nr:hypothetical protein [Haloferula rosea]MBK1827167.1 hypothetical protein [Haloferula rosea]